MKRRRRKKNNYIYVFIVIAIIASLSVGYSLLNDSLNVTGSATTVYLISGSKLNVNLIQTNNRYTTGTIPTNITFLNEVLNQNELTINFSRPNTRGKKYNSNLIITFSNPYPYNMTLGTSTVQLISGTEVQGLTVSLGKTTLVPAETGTLTVAFINTNKAPANIRAMISYTTNGVTQYFYYNVIIA